MRPIGGCESQEVKGGPSRVATFAFLTLDFPQVTTTQSPAGLQEIYLMRHLREAMGDKKAIQRALKPMQLTLQCNAFWRGIKLLLQCHPVNERMQVRPRRRQIPGSAAATHLRISRTKTLPGSCRGQDGKTFFILLYHCGCDRRGLSEGHETTKQKATDDKRGEGKGFTCQWRPEHMT